MADTFSPEERSRIMARVKSKGTKPEVIVRKWLHKHGFRFRLHSKHLPGKPDICLPKHQTVIFVHGCFWHRHAECAQATMPASNVEYWKSKFERNVKRDNTKKLELEKAGWKVLVLWECEVKSGTFINKLLESFNIKA